MHIALSKVLVVACALPVLVLTAACGSTKHPEADSPAPGHSTPGEDMTASEDMASGEGMVSGEGTAAHEGTAAGSIDFGVRVFRALVREEPDSNIFVSPTSLAFALGMVYPGAEGETRDELSALLGVGASDVDVFNEWNAALLAAIVDTEADAELSVANSIWIRDGLPVDRGFVRRNEEHYRAVVRVRDFVDPATVAEINAWVSEETRGRIDRIIQTIDPLDVMFLINALYFLGEWTEPFDEEGTVPGSFLRIDGSTVEIPFMTRKDTIDYHAGEGWEAVRLPYGDDERFAMSVVVPDHGSSLGDLYQTLDKVGWANVFTDFEPTFLELHLPRFTLEWERSLNQALQSLGVTAAFDPARADFSGISPGADDLHISEVLQKTFVQVNEKGTEAAAVTSVGMSVTSLPSYPIVRVDRPFLVAIHDASTGAVLFLGQITEPEDPEWEGR